MSVLSAIRPDSWNLPLFLHVLGAMILVGATLTSGSLLAFARGDIRLLRLGYWTLLAGALPAYVVMRIGAQWIYSKEGLDDAPIDSAWTTIGFVVADGGAVALVVALILGGIGVRRLGDDKGGRLLKAAMVLTLLLLAALVVAVWAMTAKPT
ncbi:MAG: hypothetical protein H0U82_03095 [Actinobacteria bacterium]|nr:hypothetical protein [Actinomycetota bacterium]